MTADEGEGEREREGGEDDGAERKTKSWGSKVVQPDPFRSNRCTRSRRTSWRVPANYTP